MRKEILVCFFILFPLLGFSQRKAVSLGAFAVANDINNSLSSGYSLHFEEQFDDKWTFNLSLNYATDTTRTLLTVDVNGVEKAFTSNYHNTVRRLEIDFRHYFNAAFSGLFIGPFTAVQNFDIMSGYLTGGELTALKRKATAFELGIVTGVHYKLYKSLQFHVTGTIAQGFVKASGYSGHLIITGNAGIGFAFGRKKTAY